MEATTGSGPLLGQPVGSAGRASERALRRPASLTADWPRTTRFLPWTLFSFVAMLWLVPFDSIKLPVGGPIDVTLDRPILVLLAGLWLLSVRAVRNPWPRRLSPIHWAFGVFVAVAAISIVVQGETLVRIGEMDLATKQLALLVSYAVFFALAASILRASEVTKMLKAMLVLACLTAVAVVVEYRLGINPFHDWIGPLFPGYVRPEGIGGVDSIGREQIYGPGVHPLAAAVMFSMTLPFALAWLLEAKERQQRILYGFAVVLLIAGAMATQKKTAMVGPLVCILVLAAYRPRQMLRLAPLALVLVVVVHFTAPGALGGVIDQFSPGSVNKVNTTQDRVNDYQAITPDIAEHPLLGRGYGSYDQKKHRILDNLYLTLAIGVGLAGLIAYLAILVTSFLEANRIARAGDPDRGPPAMAASASICVALVSGALLDFLSFPQLPYLLCFIAAVVFVLAHDRSGRLSL
jgi:O-antigen ligase/polysaccharide polymerase Wzy-like membrane protein